MTSASSVFGTALIAAVLYIKAVGDAEKRAAQKLQPPTQPALATSLGEVAGNGITGNETALVVDTRKIKNQFLLNSLDTAYRAEAATRRDAKNMPPNHWIASEAQVLPTGVVALHSGRAPLKEILKERQPW
jgi:hypothetical protein